MKTNLNQNLYTAMCGGGNLNQFIVLLHTSAAFLAQTLCSLASLILSAGLRRSASLQACVAQPLCRLASLSLSAGLRRSASLRTVSADLRRSASLQTCVAQPLSADLRRSASLCGLASLSPSADCLCGIQALCRLASLSLSLRHSGSYRDGGLVVGPTLG